MNLMKLGHKPVDFIHLLVRLNPPTFGRHAEGDYKDAHDKQHFIAGSNDCKENSIAFTDT